MKSISLSLIIIVVAYTTFLFPVSLRDSLANKADAATLSASKLQQKILLSDEQTTKVKSILNDYLKKGYSNNNGVTSAQDKISVLLYEKHKAKFEIIKNEWWGTFLKGVKKLPAK
jgi:hypothetical protein